MIGATPDKKRDPTLEEVGGFSLRSCLSNKDARLFIFGPSRF
jgi:hypothetical protein